MGSLATPMEFLRPTPPQPREPGRVARPDPARAFEPQHLVRKRPTGYEGAGRKGTHSESEISSRNRAIHSEVAVSRIHGLFLADGSETEAAG